MQAAGTRGAGAPGTSRLSRAAAALLIACGGLIAPHHHAPTSAQTLDCSSGIAVPNPTSNPGLVADCETLLDAQDTMSSSASLGWSASVSMINWFGVVMSGGRVTELRIAGKRLDGTIPADIDDLSALTYLDIETNQLTGSIPSSLGNLSGLTHINLANNQLSGSIPGALSNLADLSVLDLENNGLTGSLPSSLGDLSNLTALELSGNGLSGVIPTTLGDLSSLTVFTAAFNEFGGAFPSQFRRLSNLEVLDLIGIRYRTSFPTWLTDLANLTHLRLSGNELYGELPPEIGNLTDLVELDLSGLGLQHQIPAELGNLSQLTTLYLDSNDLSGDIPIELEELVNLTAISLANNSLTGCVPGSFAYIASHDLGSLGLPYCRAKPIFPATGSRVRSVSEHAAAGTAVGPPVAARDRDGEVLTYSLGGADAGSFEIDASTGQLRVAAELDYETQQTHSVTVSVRDGTDRDGNADTSIDTTVGITVEVLDVDEAPTVSGPSAVSIAENSEASLGFYSADDPEGTQVSWSVGGTDNGPFSIDENGQLTFDVPPDYESPADANRDNEYKLAVRASDDTHTVSLDVTVTVTPVDEPPVLVGPRVASINENSTGTLGSYSATDPERESVTLTLRGPDASSLTLASDGTLSLDSAPDFEQPDDADSDTVYRVTIDASDGALITSRQVRVAVRDLNEAPEVTGDTTIERNELSTSAFSVLGYYDADDPEFGNVQWRLSGDDRRAFTIDGNGYLRFAQAPDFEFAEDANQDNAYAVTVEAFDGRNTGSLDVRVTVLNDDEVAEVRPTLLYPQVGTSVGLIVDDPDGRTSGHTWTWERRTTQSGWTQIPDATSSSYTPTQADLGLRLRASLVYSDPHGSGKSVSHTWQRATRSRPGSNRAPSFQSTSTLELSVPENSGVGTAIGSLVTATDLDGDQLTYSLSGVDDDFVEIDASTGQLRTRAPLDHESVATLNVLVRATDPSGLRAQRPVRIEVTDEAEAPVLSGPHVVYTSEHSTFSVEFRSWDPDQSPLEWRLGGPDQGDLQIDSSGVVRFSSLPDADAPADSNLDNIYAVDVIVSDGTFSDSQRVQIVVANVDETGSVSLSETEALPGTKVGAQLTDPDGGVSDVSWEWQRSRNGVTWTPIAHATASSYTVARSDSGYRLRAEAVYDDGHGRAKTAVSGSVVTSLTLEPARKRQTVPAQQGSRGGGSGGQSGTSGGGGGGGGGSGGASGGVDGVEGTTLFVANGWSPADIGVAAAFAARLAGAAVVYTESEQLPPAVRALLDIRTVHVIPVIGGEAAVSNSARASLAEAEPFADIKRITGNDRVETSINAARLALDGTPDGRAVLVVANGWSPPDIGVAAMLSARLDDSAVVYTRADAVSEKLRTFIAETSPFRILIVGGPAAVSEAVENDIRAAGSASIERVSGTSRAHTAQLAAQLLTGGSARLPAGEQVVIIASGWSPPDIGIAAVLSARTSASVVAYMAPDGVPTETAELLKHLRPGLVRVVGGTAAVPAHVLSEIADLLPAGARIRRTSGSDRVHTSVSVARSVLPRD
ncbi:cadherin domain-containing protein [Candidatus Poriferisodalis sp.]|uniref:cadherin domain-containing protein n=1 Tax=Candidatus Poriferisodalis sp. TaxID=3101277 RepID=UPI003B01DED4